jgi:predicted branched-subunit amino acid permease
MNPSQIFWKGVADLLPLQLGVIPFGLVFGVLGPASGLSQVETILMSSIVFGGASQVVFAQLWAAGAAPWIVGGSVSIINMRHVLYSAAFANYFRELPLYWRVALGYLLTDEAFAVSAKYIQVNDRPKNAHFHLLGSGLTLWVGWQIATIVGVVLGTTLPETWQLGFAIPLTFIALVAPNLRNLPHLMAAFVAGCVAVLGQGLPWNLWIVCAAIAGIFAGWITGRWAKDKT